MAQEPERAVPLRAVSPLEGWASEPELAEAQGQGRPELEVQPLAPVRVLGQAQPPAPVPV